ncbi:MAG: membrane protein insertion efficiency factor YidD [Kiritimatiellaeota bacterium]|nr:membrane protein insertion efficiency factor YidD [Kiritimatiellota bacterium]
MKRDMIFCGGLLAACVLVPGAASGETVVARACRPYEAVRTMSCEVRRDKELPDGDVMRMMSRVHFKRPNLLNVETLSPFKRRIVADGATYRSHVEGQSKGLMSPVDKLPQEKQAELRMVPGTLGDVLGLLVGQEERRLEPLAEFPVRAGYAGEKAFTVLSLDSSNRLARVEVFSDADMGALVARTDFSAFQEVLPGVWIATLQRAIVTLNGMTVAETTRIGNITVNRDLPESLFRAEGFFKGVKFTDTSEKNARFDPLPSGMDPVFARLVPAVPDAWLAAPRPPAKPSPAAALGREAVALPARAFITLYRTQVSPAIGDRCNLEPSCSEYFVQAVKAHGALGIPLIADRFFREPSVHAAAAKPVVMPSGRIRYADPLSDHDFWMRP